MLKVKVKVFLQILRISKFSDFSKRPRFTLAIPARKHHGRLEHWEYCNCHLSFELWLTPTPNTQKVMFDKNAVSCFRGLLIDTSPSSASYPAHDPAKELTAGRSLKHL